MSLKTVSGVLAAAVADAGTFTVAFPTGTTRGNFAPMGVNHRLVMNQVELQSPNKITLAFTTLVTITNKTGATWPIGSPFVLQLETTGEANGRVSTTAVPMPAVTDCPLSWVDLGTPLALQAAGLRAAAAVGGAGALVLIQTFLDVPRNLTFLSAGNDTGITFTITGKDTYGMTMSEVVTGANAGTAAGKKAFATGIAVVASGAAAGNVSIGWGNVLGIPVFIPGAVVIVKESQDGAVAVAGTLVAGDQAFPSTTTGDVRGTYVPNAAPDASKAYALICALPDPRYLGATQI